MPNRFPKPWRVAEQAECVMVEDDTGFPIAYFYFAKREVIGTNPDRMTKRQALTMARAFAKIGQ